MQRVQTVFALKEQSSSSFAMQQQYRPIYGELSALKSTLIPYIKLHTQNYYTIQRSMSRLTQNKHMAYICTGGHAEHKSNNKR